MYGVKSYWKVSKRNTQSEQCMLIGMRAMQLSTSGIPAAGVPVRNSAVEQAFEEHKRNAIDKLFVERYFGNGVKVVVSDETSDIFF